jgi:peptidoglycan/xylan/chitin deacetylase (PgdA/CDA1 family)
VEARRARGRVTVVLLYHDVVERAEQDDAGFRGPLAARYKLDPLEFAAHLDAIAATRLTVGTLDPASELPEVVLTFDDGGASALAAADAVERHGWRAHFFVATSLIGTPGFLEAAEIAELVRRGHVVGSHSHTHPTYMARLSRGALENEWSTSRGILRDVLGDEPATASVPGGMVSRQVVETAAAAGFRVLMTSEPSAAVRDRDGLLTVGRFGIWSTTPAARAAAYARGAWAPRTRLWLEWNAKAITKRVSPEMYQHLRRLRARRA